MLHDPVHNEADCCFFQNQKCKQKLKMLKPYFPNRMTKKVETLKRQQLDVDIKKKMLKTSISLRDLRIKKERIISNKNNVQDKHIQMVKQDGLMKIKNKYEIQNNYQKNNNRILPISHNRSYYQANFVPSLLHKQQIISTVDQIKSALQSKNTPPLNITFSYSNIKQESKHYLNMNHQKVNNLKSLIQCLPLNLTQSSKKCQQSSPRTVVSIVIGTQGTQSVILERASNFKGVLNSHQNYYNL